MARNGVLIEETLICRGQTASEVTARLLEVVTQSGEYKAVQVGPSRLQFARTFRPTWAIVAGCLTLVIALVGVFFFLVKTTETCTATVEEDHTGTRIRLAGRLDRDTLAGLRLLSEPLAGGVPGAATAVGAGAVVGSAYDIRDAAPIGPAARTLIDHSPSVPPPAAPAVLVTPAPSVGAVPPGPTPVLPPVAPPSTLPPPFTVGHAAKPSPSSAVTGHPQVLLDDGVAVAFDRLILLGRDPSASEAEGDAVLIPVEDPQRSVSKTHLAISYDAAGFWAVDRRSTNGTEMLVDGRTTQLVPGERIAVPAGAVVRFGGRSLTLSLVGDGR